MKKLLLFLLFPIVAWVSCSGPKYLPSPYEFRNHVHGLHIEAIIKDTSNQDNVEYWATGEIIAVDDSALYIRTSTQKVVRCPRYKVLRADVIVATTSDNPASVNAMAIAANVLTISHGVWLTISLPVNLAVAIPLAVDAQKGTYIMKYPNDLNWDQMKKFARFPQGMPPNFAMSPY